jgi:hypothetical protein
VIIVSDTSPINNLAAINQLHLLHQLYGTVLIPKAVYRELTDSNFPVAGATEVQAFDWIQTRTVNDRTLVEALSNELDIGEAEAIALAAEIQAEQSLYTTGFYSLLTKLVLSNESLYCEHYCNGGKAHFCEDLINCSSSCLASSIDNPVLCTIQ